MCGPKLNADREIDFYFPTKSLSACEPRNRNANNTALCAAATSRSACQAKLLKCVWRVPKPVPGCKAAGCS